MSFFSVMYFVCVDKFCFFSGKTQLRLMFKAPQLQLQRYLFNEIKAQIALDVSPKAFWQIFQQVHLIFSSHSCPSLAFVMTNSLSETRRQLSPFHPPFHISASQLHFSLLCHNCMQKYLWYNPSFRFLILQKKKKKYSGANIIKVTSYYLDVSYQQSEEKQSSQNNAYAEHYFQPVTCWFKIIAEGAVCSSISKDHYQFQFFFP